MMASEWLFVFTYPSAAAKVEVNRIKKNTAGIFFIEPPDSCMRAKAILRIANIYAGFQNSFPISAILLILIFSPDVNVQRPLNW